MQDQGRDGDQEGQRCGARTHFKRPSVEADDPFEDRFPRPDRAGFAGLRSCACSSLAHIIGVSVSETTAEMRMVTPG